MDHRLYIWTKGETSFLFDSFCDHGVMPCGSKGVERCLWNPGYPSIN